MKAIPHPHSITKSIGQNNAGRLAGFCVSFVPDGDSASDFGRLNQDNDPVDAHPRFTVAAWHHSRVKVRLEFWPDYNSEPLWDKDQPVPLAEHRLPPDLTLRISDWLARYDESRLPIDGPGDQEWLYEGKGILRELREALSDRYEIVVTEPWWGEPASDY